MQLSDWLGVPQTKPLVPGSIASTTRRPSTVSVRTTASASLVPLLRTAMVNVWRPVPASTLASAKVLATWRATFSVMSTLSRPVAAVGCSSAVALAVLPTAVALFVVEISDWRWRFW